MGTPCSWCGIASSPTPPSSFHTIPSLCICTYVYRLFQERSFSILEPLLCRLLSTLETSPSNITPNLLYQEVLRKDIDSDWYKRVIANLDFRGEVTTIRLPLDKSWRRKLIRNLTWIKQCMFAATFRIAQAIESTDMSEVLLHKDIDALAIDVNRETLEYMNSPTSASRTSYIRVLEDILHKLRGNPTALAYSLATIHNLAVVCISEPTTTFTRRLKVWLKNGIDALSHIGLFQKMTKTVDELTLLEIYNVYFESFSTLASMDKSYRYIRYYLVKLVWLQVSNQTSQPIKASEDSIEPILLLVKAYLENDNLDEKASVCSNQNVGAKATYSLLPIDDIGTEYGVTLYLLMGYYAQRSVKEAACSLVEKCVRFLGAEFYPAYYLLGHIKYHERHYSEALEYFQKCFAADKSLRSDSFNMAGCSAVHMSKPNLAVKYFKFSLESNIRSNYPLWNLCVVYERTGKLPVETKMLTHLVERLTSDSTRTNERSHPCGTGLQPCMNLLNVVSRLGAIYLEQGKYKEAATEYSNVISPTRELEIAKQYSTSGATRKAIRDYVYTLLMLDPTEFDQAINICKSILQIDPLDISIQMYLAEAIWYKDQTVQSAKKAQAIYLTVEGILSEVSQLSIQEDCNEEPVMKKTKLEAELCTAGWEIRKLRNRLDVERLFDEAYRKSLLVQTYNNLAHMLSALGLTEEAIEALTKSVGLSSDNLHPIYNLTLLRLRTGKDLEATYGWLDFRGIELRSSIEYYKGLIAEVEKEIDKLSRKELDTLTPMFKGDKADHQEWNEIEYLDLRHLDLLILTNACELADH